MADVGGRLGGISKIIKALAVSAVCGVILLYCGIFALKALLWALPDAPWTHHDRTHVETSAPTTLASANTTVPTSAPEQVDEPAPVAPASKAAIPSRRSALPDPVPTTVADSASRVGMGELWRNVCGNSRTGYRLCRGSTPTDAQRAADFPPGAKDL